MSYDTFLTDSAKLPLRSISQFAMQSIDMHSAPCATVAAALTQGATLQNKTMTIVAAGVRLHQCHITYFRRIERNSPSGIFLN
jgi:hypothetical protein